MANLGIEPKTFVLLARRSNQLSQSADNMVWEAQCEFPTRFASVIE